MSNTEHEVMDDYVPILSNIMTIQMSITHSLQASMSRSNGRSNGNKGAVYIKAPDCNTLFVGLKCRKREKEEPKGTHKNLIQKLLLSEIPSLRSFFY